MFISLGARHIWAQARQRFEQAGGVVLEHAAAQGVTVHPDGVALQMPAPHRANGASSEQVLYRLAPPHAHMIQLSEVHVLTGRTKTPGQHLP